MEVCLREGFKLQTCHVHLWYVVKKVSSKRSLKKQKNKKTVEWLFQTFFYIYSWCMKLRKLRKLACQDSLVHGMQSLLYVITDLSIKLLVLFLMSFCSQIRGLHLNMFGIIFRGPLSFIQAKLFFPEKEQKKVFPVMNLLIKMLREGGYFHIQGTCPCK